MTKLRKIIYIIAFIIISLAVIMLDLWMLNDKAPFSSDNIIFWALSCIILIPIIMLIKKIFK
jgi:hypothetical protein